MISVETATEEVPKADAAIGEPKQYYSIGTETERCETVERGTDAEHADLTNTECQTDSKESTEIAVQALPSVADADLQTDDQLVPKTNFGVNTDPEPPLKPVEVPKIDQATATDELPAVDEETMTTPKYYRSIPIQTETPEEAEEREILVAPSESSAINVSSDAECQTETDSTVDSTVSDDVTGDAVVVDCPRCRQREETFTRNVGVGACSIADKVCIECDKATPDEVDENDVPGFKVEKDDVRSKEFDRARAEAVKKLLTSEQKQPFSSSVTPPTPATTPAGETTDALKNKVVLKKGTFFQEIPLPPSNLPEPVPARIPRPKISKYAVLTENAETPDEEEEAADRLTPLRSELRSLGRWPRSNTQVPYNPYKSGSDSDDDSDDSEGSYDTHEDGADYEDTAYEITTPMREAMESLNSHLLQPGTITPETADWALKYVQHEWLKCSARKSSKAEAVDVLIEQIKELSPALLKVVGNTALHYAVSHGNFGVVSSLLDSGECQLNLSNRAGYSAVMLAALSSLENEVEKAVVQRLFELGDVNARAQQHGQTALMLSVSHGKKNTTELLLNCGADVNLQDEEGSTALMCAAEHGHKDIVKLLLSQDGIDASLMDCDSSTALSIAVENGHRDIGVLIYAHLNYSRAETIDDMSRSMLSI
ncbi:unnamed protein product [Nippostrongylus brasiliensis]|uniref:ANK_REP_REGION domain-containing protein n=1 Tax=Nippostrongylus brasiliensis TaxID=27835 RepID=A0A0N4XCL4_NIPBR|nr:unnamed protein product [Nippostrongylus brasiliensis]